MIKEKLVQRIKMYQNEIKLNELRIGECLLLLDLLNNEEPEIKDKKFNKEEASKHYNLHVID